MKVLNKIPFDNLRICYFKLFDVPTEKIFLDATDEQILNLLCKQFHETVVIQKIEDVDVSSVITTIPTKKKLDVSELKFSLSIEEKNARELKIKTMRDNHS
jgi:hypothetical protein